MCMNPVKDELSMWTRLVTAAAVLASLLLLRPSALGMGWAHLKTVVVGPWWSFVDGFVLRWWAQWLSQAAACALAAAVLAGLLWPVWRSVFSARRALRRAENSDPLAVSAATMWLSVLVLASLVVLSVLVGALALLDRLGSQDAPALVVAQLLAALCLGLSAWTVWDERAAWSREIEVRLLRWENDVRVMVAERHARTSQEDN